MSGSALTVQSLLEVLSPSLSFPLLLVPLLSLPRINMKTNFNKSISKMLQVLASLLTINFKMDRRIRSPIQRYLFLSIKKVVYEYIYPKIRKCK